MDRCIVHSERGVTIVGAGELLPAVLDEALIHAPLLVAADGGAARALALGHDLAAVIGDLDSLEATTRAALPPGRVHRIADQETTDFDKCLRTIRAPLVLAVGFTGARLDHELAAFSTLLQHAGRPCLLIGPEDVAFVAPLDLRLALAPGTRLSLFPMGEVTGESRGLRWPIEGIRFAPGGRIGTSNEAAAPEVALSFSARRMLVFLPRPALGSAIRALAPGYAAQAAARGE
ncbi:MAG: thiamine diphosphokinase [Paracoccaceae bacterium]|nr:thiamine diphosphokinase [Paracoccaceae bacterium]